MHILFCRGWGRMHIGGQGVMVSFSIFHRCFFFLHIRLVCVLKKSGTTPKIHHDTMSPCPPPPLEIPWITGSKKIWPASFAVGLGVGTWGRWVMVLWFSDLVLRHLAQTVNMWSQVTRLHYLRDGVPCRYPLPQAIHSVC